MMGFLAMVLLLSGIAFFWNNPLAGLILICLGFVASAETEDTGRTEWGQITFFYLALFGGLSAVLGF